MSSTVSHARAEGLRDAPSFERTLPQLLREHARAAPERLALIARSGYGGAETERVTSAQLEQLVSRCAAALAERGVRRGDRVALLFDNLTGVEALASLYAVHAAGAVNVPINTRFTTDDVVALLGYCNARFALGGQAVLERLGERLAAVDGLSGVIAAGERRLSWAEDWSEALERCSTSAGELELEPEDYADWLFTSGTTGAPKCVMTTHRGCVATGAILARTFGVEAGDVLHTPFPFYTSSGCHSSALSALWAGATYVMEPAVDVEAIARRVQTEGSTVFGAVPSVYIFLLESGWLQRLPPASLRTIFVGGAALMPALVEQLAEAFAGATLVNVYGLTEAGNAGLMNRGEEVRARPGSIGREGMPWTEFRLLDQAGEPVASGEVGEICLRTPSMMDGYFGDEQASRSAFRDGWLLTGDLARKDDDGYLFVYDRRKDVIIRGGFNISSLEIEGALTAHPDVLDAAVVAKPHAHLGEDIRAFVVTTSTARLAPEELMRHCAERLADFKVPRDIVFVEELPRSPTGKVQKAVLRAEAVAEPGRG
jgi:acyl-CoA synthetase (AMP-forming)/AMP-acid ligase II